MILSSLFGFFLLSLYILIFHPEEIIEIDTLGFGFLFWNMLLYDVS
jgi:hypothetical protein